MTKSWFSSSFDGKNQSVKPLPAYKDAARAAGAKLLPDASGQAAIIAAVFVKPVPIDVP